jgi:hypothetical protein
LLGLWLYTQEFPLNHHSRQNGHAMLAVEDEKAKRFLDSLGQYRFDE